MRLAPFGEGNPRPLLVSEPVRLVRAGQAWLPAVRPELRLATRHSVQVTSGVLCRLLYSVDDSGGLTIEDCRPVAEDA
jgi:hypothetical protein